MKVTWTDFCHDVCMSHAAGCTLWINRPLFGREPLHRELRKLQLVRGAGAGVVEGDRHAEVGHQVGGGARVSGPVCQ